MGTKKVAISLPEWVLKEMIGESENRSARIQELLIKGYMSEKQKLYISGQELKPLDNSPFLQESFSERFLEVPNDFRKLATNFNNTIQDLVSYGTT